MARFVYELVCRFLGLDYLHYSHFLQYDTLNLSFRQYSIGYEQEVSNVSGPIKFKMC